jgi:hypothetical protein
MKRRPRAGGKASKPRSHDAPKMKRRHASKNALSSAPSKDEEVTRLARELNQALEQQAATSEVLHFISSSPGDLQRVFDTMLANAVRVCQAGFGILWLAEGDHFRSVALHNLPPALAAARRREPVVYFGPQSGTGRVVQRGGRSR